MGWSANSKKNKGNYQDIQGHQRLMDPIGAMTNRNIRSVKWIRVSILFSRMTVNVLVFVLHVVFFNLIMYIVTRYMYDAVRRHFVLSTSFVLECFDGSEVTTREGNELIVLKENCVVEEIKETELRSRRGNLQFHWFESR